MCKYCSEIFTGNVSDYDLVRLKISMNGLGDLFGIQTWIDSDSEKGKAYIRTNFHDQHGRYIAVGEMQIQYCPMCGRKLEKES